MHTAARAATHAVTHVAARAAEHAAARASHAPPHARRHAPLQHATTPLARVGPPFPEQRHRAESFRKPTVWGCILPFIAA